MRRNQILVRNIKHLTDARYFAAMGVDWMSMELNGDPASFMRWHTFKDWVEGVQLAAEIHIPDEMLLAKIIIDAKPDGIILDQVMDLEGVSTMQLFFDLQDADRDSFPAGSFKIMHFDEIDADRFLDLDPNKTFLQCEWTLDLLDQLLIDGYLGGFCFSGGEEDTTGMRDYEQMDALIDRVSRIEA